MTAWSVVRLRHLEWEALADGTNRLRDPGRGEWVRTSAWTRSILQAVDGGGDVDASIAASLAHPEAPSLLRARRFVLTLEKVGYVRVAVVAPRSFGRWLVDGELGRGGVGLVYAVSADGERAVAKLPWDFLHPLDVTAAAIRREAEVLAALDHPGVVRRLDLVEQDGLPVLVRERVDGASLTALHDGAPADAATAARAAREIGALLDHAHARGLLLVDYKPSNFVREDATGRLRLLDAGHMRAPGTRKVGGTPGFMPPELERREAGTGASDVWGLGRIYAFLRSGRLPALRSKDESILDGVPEEARAFVARLCAEDPAARPASVADALALLPA